MEAGGDQEAATKAEEGRFPAGRVDFIHPCSPVHVLLVASSAVLVFFSVGVIWVWRGPGRGDENFRWMAYYHIALLSLVAAVWAFRLVRAVVLFEHVHRRPHRVEVVEDAPGTPENNVV